MDHAGVHASAAASLQVRAWFSERALGSGLRESKWCAAALQARLSTWSTEWKPSLE